MAKKKEENKVMEETAEEKMQEGGQAARTEEIVQADQKENPEQRKGRMVETIVEYLRVRAGAGTHYVEVAILNEPEGEKRAHCIVEEKKGWGLLEEYQEHRNGWICLEFTRAAG